MTRRTAAFTLIEMLAVMLFTSIVIVFIVDFFIDLSRASSAATAKTRDGRRAAAILDRVARDLQTAVLVVKPEGEDPLAHPWVFLAEAGAGDGAERLKFVSRGRISRASSVHDSDLEQVAYFVADAEDGGTELLRWSLPRLGEGLDRRFPAPDDEGVLVLSHDIEAFGVRLLDEAGEWTDEWDSSTLVRSSTLPVAAEINVALHPEDERELGGFEDEEPRLWTRRVELPVRPIDLQELLEGGAAGEDEDEDEEDAETDESMTVAECGLKVQREAPPGVVARLAEDPGLRVSQVALELAQAGWPLEECQ